MQIAACVGAVPANRFEFLGSLLQAGDRGFISFGKQKSRSAGMFATQFGERTHSYAIAIAGAVEHSPDFQAAVREGIEGIHRAAPDLLYSFDSVLDSNPRAV